MPSLCQACGSSRRLCYQANGECLAFGPGVLTHCVGRRTGYTAKFPNPEPIPCLEPTLHKKHRSVAQQTSLIPCMVATSKGLILLTDMAVRSSSSREHA